ncbi:MAG: hypothetical protein QOG15_1686 [Solirubrobacteraceae bacterium]|jgi:hypothetical protein|nr:hypothetical protein [Solirubrobacteraceae bacterium]
MRPTRTPASVAAPERTLGEWRRRRLIAAGFDAALATRLTRDGAVDLHELLVLVDRGCPPELAARILAPLGAPSAS